MIDALTALFLGVIEGLTEFIPVSSTAHLIILTEIMDFKTIPGHVFEVFIQLGAILAVIVLYRKKLFGTAFTFVSDKTSRHFALNLVIGTIPAVIVGLLGHEWIKGYLYNPHIIAATLIGGGIILVLVEKFLTKEKTIQNVDAIPHKTALIVGLCQMLALVPGISRSGATIVGGLLCGMQRSLAAEFSFFLAVPIMLGAVAYDTYKNWGDIVAHESLNLMAIGLFAAFITALLILKLALSFINRYGFTLFGWYRIAAGIGLLLIFS